MIPAQNLQLDPKTGDYIIANGRPVEDNTLNTPAYIRLKTSRGGANAWLFAPDTTYGSDFYLYQSRHLLQNDQAILAAAAHALQPLIDSGRATGVSVTENDSSRNNFELTATITQANQQTTPLTFVAVTN